MRIYTCTPVDFIGNPSFFARDSGLGCRGLQMLGVESRAIMPGPERLDDEPDLIRTDYANLESSDWWRSLELGGLIFYSWSNPQYTPIARAIKQAGIRLMVNMDTGGLLTPRVEPSSFWYAVRSTSTLRHGKIVGSMVASVRVCWALLPWSRDLPRLKHLEQADVIGAISPIAAKRISGFLQVYHRQDLAERVKLIPHPVASYLRYDGCLKKPWLLCVGRWDSSQKNVELAVSVIAIALVRHPKYEVHFIGSGGNLVRSLVSKLDAINTRIHVLDRLPNRELTSYYQSSQISLCSSHYESGHIVSEEALCCGCTVVAPNSPTLPSMGYYVSQQSGQLGGRDVDSLGMALCNEIEKWEAGERNPMEISRYWCEQLHVDRIAQRMVMALGLDEFGSTKIS